VAKQIKGTLEITTYVNLLDQHVYAGLPVSRNTDLARFEDFRRFIPGIKMSYVYYYDATDLAGNPNMIYQGDIQGLSIEQIAGKVADNLQVDLKDFLPPAQIRRTINLEPEGNTFVRRLTYNGKSSYLRLYNENNQFPEEAEITAAIKKLITPNQKIVFADGDDERSITIKGDRSYELFSNARKARKSLINQGFEVVSIDLNKSQLPSGASILVIADPAKPFSSNAFLRIRQYLNAGGNMLITSEPQHRAVINPLLAELGVQLSGGMMVNPDRNTPPDLINARFTGNPNNFEQMKNPYATVAMPTAAMLEVQNKGFTMDTLLRSNPKGWNKVNEFDPSSTAMSYEPKHGDRLGSKPLILALTRNVGNKQQKIVISGDADFMSNNLIVQAYNLPFIYGIFRWFSDGAFPVKVKRAAPTDDAILANCKQLSVYRLATLWALPALIIACGAALLLIRKRK
jgi:ABC-2 type transport system permease protein